MTENEKLVCSYWKLLENPFKSDIDLKYYFETEETKNLIHIMLGEIIEKKRTTLLQGERGSGKTVIGKMIGERLPVDEWQVINIPSGLYTGITLLQKVFNVIKPTQYAPDGFLTLSEMVSSTIKQGYERKKKNYLLILDNADLNKELEDYMKTVDLLTTTASQKNSLLSIIITGKNNLKRLIEHPFHNTPPCSQYYLNALDENQAREYVAFRLQKAGNTLQEVFSPDTLSLIFAHTKGLPAEINELCYAALLQGVSSGGSSITPALMETAIKNRKSEHPAKHPLNEIIASTLLKKEPVKVPPKDPSVILYRKLLDKSQELFKLKGQKVFLMDVDGIRELLKELIELLKTGNTNIASLAKEPVPAQNYLPVHSVNVCILSTSIGLIFGYDDVRIFELALSSFLHDIGMIDMLDPYKPGKLASGEFENIKEHASRGKDILMKLKEHYLYGDLKPEAILAHHERVDGTGYPQGIKGKENIDEYAKIIGVVDVFEALTHERSHRKEMKPLDAVSLMMEMDGNKFDMSFVTALTHEISIYVPGMIVKLNSGQIARVTQANDRLPARPKIRVKNHEEENTEGEEIDLELHNDMSIIDIVGIEKD